MERINFNQILIEAIEKPGKLLEAYKAFYNYSLGNRILAMCQCHAMNTPISPIATFNQWKQKGRYIKKGSKAIKLCMPITKKYNKTLKDSVTGQEVEKEVNYTNFVYKSNWFVLSQTEGPDFELDDININWDQKNALLKLGIKEINFEIFNGNAQGYATINNEIAINPIAQLPLKTMFHEIAHIILGHTDLKTLSDCNELDKSLIEVEAEAVALLCLESLGMDGSEYCRGYIQNWLKGNKISEKSAQRIISGADKILQAGS